MGEQNSSLDRGVGAMTHGELTCLMLRLDVDIGGHGIVLGSIPKQPWY